MTLNRRLARCAEYVAAGGVLLDIGTDHALLPCFLAQKGSVLYAVAADIAEGPLCSAKRTIAENGLSDRVFTAKSDGFAGIPKKYLSEATDAVIAGMGGEMIVKILSEAGDFPKKLNLVLQPNSRAGVLRRWLAENGYGTLRESAVRDGRHVYAVINARFDGAAARAVDGLYAAVGKIDPSDPDGREYYLAAAKRLRAAAKGLAAGNGEGDAEEAERLGELAERIEGVLEF